MISRLGRLLRSPVVWGGGGIVAGLLVFAFWPNQISGAKPAGGGSQTVVRRGDLTLTVDATGSLAAERAENIGPPAVDGMWNFRIARLAQEGIQVKPGDLLIEFDGQEVNRRLAEKRAEMNKIQEEISRRKLEYDVQLRDLRIRVEESRVSLQKARHKAEVDPTLISMQDYRLAKVELEQSESEAARLAEKLESTLRMARAELAGLENTLEGARLRVQRLEEQKKALVVNAPAAGVVIFKRNEAGEKKSVGQQAWRRETIMQIPDLATLRLEAMVEEAEAGQVRPGQKAVIRVDAFPGTQLRGTTTSIGTVLRTKRFDMPTKVVDAVIEFDKGEQKLLPGMTATASIEVQRIPSVLLVPLEAIRERQGQSVVTVLLGSGVAQERSIRLGRRNSELIEVLEGLKEGDRVAL